MTPLQIRRLSTGLDSGRKVVQITAVSASGDAHLPLLCELNLVITGAQRLATGGANASGKPRWLRVASGLLAPDTGKVHRPVASALLDQPAEVPGPIPIPSMLENAHVLDPQASDFRDVTCWQTSCTVAATHWPA